MSFVTTHRISTIPNYHLFTQDSIADITLQQVLTRAKEFDVIATMNLNGETRRSTPNSHLTLFRVLRPILGSANAVPLLAAKVTHRIHPFFPQATICPMHSLPRLVALASRPVATSTTRRAMRFSRRRTVRRPSTRTWTW